MPTPSRPAMPPFVYVPTTSEDDPQRRQVVMHRVADGRVALYTYSAIDRLHSIYRAGSHWIGCDVAALQRLFELTPYDLLFVDVDPQLDDEESDRGE